jgi:lysophospholipase L1-like esterase
LKVAQFKAYPNSTKDIIFLGNSITANTDLVEELGNPNLRNRGISGDITFGVLERLDEVIDGKPAKVFILIGINDISRNIPDQVILRNYQKMVSRINKGSPGTKIYFQTLLPTNSTFDRFKNHYNKEDHILGVNNALKELGRKEKITVIDLYPAFLDNQNRLKKELTHDGLHLTPAGYRTWVEVLRKGKYLD